MNFGTASLHLETAGLKLTYTVAATFKPDTLSIKLKHLDTTWHYGEVDTQNLKGTYRTLDTISGSTPLEDGLLSRSGWAVIDDSHTLIFNDEGWLEARAQAESSQDLYFFGYGQAYAQCLRDYCQIAGEVPLLPRWALGNWWSRYHAYTQADLTALMESFRQHEVPLSVCIVDMDWHLTDVGPYNGWTGYTWNRELFPDPEAFITWLHELGLKTALNLHPALGIRPYEAAYAQMCARLDLDPESGETIPFNIADPTFALAYFELLHHPQEAIGVDFWWLDWQQGTLTAMPGLDPLYWLNHLHFFDIARAGRKRPFIFSRWGGLGNHRYPIGFSGDTWVDWDSLAFQPYFTATAANVGYSWWSHDIGGHMFGVEEPELYARWVQFGVFSPIFRLHCTNNPFHERRPWAYPAHIYQATKQAMQLRHALIPYIYTMSWRNHSDQLPFVRATYFDYPEAEAAYHCPQQYLFGSDLLAAPYTETADPDTNLSRQVVWLPPGDWYHFFSGEHFAGDQWTVQYGSLADIPVFARAGAIIPLGPNVGWGGVENPDSFNVHVFAGADNQFDLYEDDGETTAHATGAYCLTTFRQQWQEQRLTLTVGSGHDPAHVTPPVRAYQFMIHGIQYPDGVTVTIDGHTSDYQLHYDADTETLHLNGVSLSPQNTLQITLAMVKGTLLARRDRTAEKCGEMLTHFTCPSQAKLGISQNLLGLIDNPALLANFKTELSPSQMRALLELSQSAGVHQVRDTRDPFLLLMWNNRQTTPFTYQYHETHHHQFEIDQRYQVEQGPLPAFQTITPPGSGTSWELTVDYGGLTAVTYQSDSP